MNRNMRMSCPWPGASRYIAQLLAVSFICLAAALQAAAGAPAAEPWPRWEASDASSTRVINHDAWSQLLHRRVRTGADGVNRFDYAGVTAAERQELGRYIAGLEAVDPDGLNRAEQKAFWINLYNAVTVQLVLAHYPVASIRDIRSGFLGLSGPWTAVRVEVNGIALSLDDIEHRILRPGWRDPRIHYAVNCASIGCPDLQAEAFTAANTERLLEKGAAAYINHPRGVRVSEGGLYLSSIYDWFREDFGGTEGVIRHLKNYAAPELTARIDSAEKVAGYGYDWALNQ